MYDLKRPTAAEIRAAAVEDVERALDEVGAPGFSYNGDTTLPYEIGGQIQVLMAVDRIRWLHEQIARRYFKEQENEMRKCPLAILGNKDCDGILEYIQSEKREGERCPKCGFTCYGRK